VINVRIEVEHPHGHIEINESERLAGLDEEQAVRSMRRAVERAARRVECAILAKEQTSG
jgi:hypothetical protein